MPEGPETHRLSYELAALFDVPFWSNIGLEAEPTAVAPAFKGATLVSITARDFKGLEYEPLLLGKQVVSIEHAGKVTLIRWSSGRTLQIFYAMTGRFSLVEGKHSRVCFGFDGGRNLYYDDIRKFGRVSCYFPFTANPSLFHANTLCILNWARVGLREFCLTNFQGVGNYLVNELLWAAKLHPLTPSATLTVDQVKGLVAQARRLYTASVKARGCTLATFKGLDEKPGSFQNQLKCYRVKQCSRCTSDMERLKVAGTSHWFCPSCQPCLHPKT